MKKMMRALLSFLDLEEDALLPSCIYIHARAHVSLCVCMYGELRAHLVTR